MAQTAIAADVHQALDVQLNFRTQRPFELQVGNVRADGRQFIVGEFVGALVPVNLALRQDSLRRRATDAEDVSKGDFDALFARNIYASKTSHCLIACVTARGLTLTLLVFFGARTNDEDSAATADDLAVFADSLDGSTDFHSRYRKLFLVYL